MTDPDASPVSYALLDGIAVIDLDDGKANAISPSVLATLGDLLDRAEADGARALVLAGREGRFSAGFDLTEMTASPERMRALVGDGARFLSRLYTMGMPTVAACTGHALAMGALLLLASDHRVGADGPFKIGLNEVAIGMPLPVFAVELARDRLVPAQLTGATALARVYDPAGALAAGYLDALAGPDGARADAIATAGALAELRTGAVARTKKVLRQATVDHVLRTLDEDLATVDGPDA